MKQTYGTNNTHRRTKFCLTSGAILWGHFETLRPAPVAIIGSDFELESPSAFPNRDAALVSIRSVTWPSQSCRFWPPAALTSSRSRRLLFAALWLWACVEGPTHFYMEKRKKKTAVRMFWSVRVYKWWLHFRASKTMLSPTFILHGCAVFVFLEKHSSRDSVQLVAGLALFSTMRTRRRAPSVYK